MTEQKREIPVVRQIQEAISLCYEAGREPVALLVSHEVFEILNKELRKTFMPDDLTKEQAKLFDLPLLVVAKMKDFFLVDNRSWVEQKF